MADSKKAVEEAVEATKKTWDENYQLMKKHICEIEVFRGSKEEISIQRLNALSQDCLAALSSAEMELDLLLPQISSHHQLQSASLLLHQWKQHSRTMRSSLRSANLKATSNMKKYAQEQRELLLGAGEESTIRRRDLKDYIFITQFYDGEWTKAGMTSAAESITESLRRTRQLMVQEVERSANTLATFEESTGVLKKADTEYKGHKSLLARTRKLLTTMQREDLMDRVILGVGFFVFLCVVLYIVSKRIGLLKLQRKIAAAIRGGFYHDEL